MVRRLRLRVRWRFIQPAPQNRVEPVSETNTPTNKAYRIARRGDSGLSAVVAPIEDPCGRNGGAHPSCHVDGARDGIVSKNTNELKPGAPGRFGLALRSELSGASAIKCW